jgi:hypothetical protein
MNKRYLIALITSVIGTGCIYLYMISVDKKAQYGILDVALFMTFEIFIMLMAGTILISSEKTKTSGSGILIGMAITLVIGFGVCTSY